jgi:hypothetical protein
MSEESEDPLAEVGNKVGAGITTAMMGARMAVEIARRMRSDAITEWAETDSQDWKERVRTFNPDLVDAYDKGISEGMDPTSARRYAADVVTTNTAIRAAERNPSAKHNEDRSEPKKQPADASPTANTRPAGTDDEASRIRVSEQHADMARRAERRHQDAYRKARDRGLPETQARRAAAREWRRTWETPGTRSKGSESVRPRTLGHYGDPAAPRPQSSAPSANQNPTKGSGRP